MRISILVFVILAVLAIYFIKPKKVEKAFFPSIKPNGKCSSRGGRNNNPGNIRIGSTNWVGKIPNERNTDGAFEQFETWELGLRAMMKNLLTYFDRGLNTVSLIVSTWAPPTENSTNIYVSTVAKSMGVSPNQALNPTREVLFALVRPMVRLETGCEVTAKEFEKAWKMVVT